MKTKSVEFMPFYLSLFSLLTSFMWTLYGVLGRDPYLTVSIQSGFTLIYNNVLWLCLAPLFVNLFSSELGTKQRRVFNWNPSAGCVLHL